MAKIRRLEGDQKRIYKRESGVQVRSIVPQAPAEQDPEPDLEELDPYDVMDSYFSSDEEDS